MATATDTFSTSAVLTTPWTNQTATFTANGTVVNPTSLAGDAASVYNGSPLGSVGPDQYAQVVIGTLTGSSGGVGPCVRWATGAKTGYSFVVRSTTYTLVRFVAGGFTSLATGSVTFSSGDVLRLEVMGQNAETVLVAKHAPAADPTNFSTVAAVVDGGGSAINSGFPGLAYSSTMTAAPLDNWEGGDLPNPAVEQRTESSVTTAGTTHSVTRPTAVAGRLVLILFGYVVTGQTITWPGGYTPISGFKSEQTNRCWDAAYHVDTGAEGTSISVGTSVNTKSCHLAYSISGAADPTTQAPERGTVATGAAGTSSDPPSVSGTGGSKDYLFIAAMNQAGEELDDDTWCNTAPTNYVNLIQKTTGTGGVATTNCSMAAAVRLYTSASDNPGTFNTDQTTNWTAQTIVIHPAGPAGQTLTPSAFAIPCVVPAPTLSLGAVTFTPSPVALPLVVPSPTLTKLLTLTPDAAAISFLTAAPTVALGAISLSPDAVPLPVITVPPTVSLGTLTLTPDAVATLLSIPAVTLDFSTLLYPDPVAVALGLPVPTVALGALSLTPSAVAVPLVVPAVSISTGGATTTLTPDAVAVLLGLPSPTVSFGALTLTPGAVATPLVLLQPTIALGALTLTPDPLACILIVPDPSVNVAFMPQTVTPDALAIWLNVPGITILGLTEGGSGGIYRILRRRR